MSKTAEGVDLDPAFTNPVKQLYHKIEGKAALSGGTNPTARERARAASKSKESSNKEIKYLLNGENISNMDLDNVSEATKSQIAALFQRQDPNGGQRHSNRSNALSASAIATNGSGVNGGDTSRANGPSSSKTSERHNQSSRTGIPSNSTPSRSRPPPATVETCSESSSTSSESDDSPVALLAPKTSRAAPSNMPAAPDHRASKPTSSSASPVAVKKAVTVVKTPAAGLDRTNQHKRVNFSTHSNAAYFHPRQMTFDEEDDDTSSSKLAEEHAMQFLATVNAEPSQSISPAPKVAIIKSPNHFIPNIVHSNSSLSVPTSTNTSVRSTSPISGAVHSTSSSVPASSASALPPARSSAGARWLPGKASADSNTSFRSSRGNGNPPKSRAPKGGSNLFGEENDTSRSSAFSSIPATKPVPSTPKSSEPAKASAKSGNTSRSRDSESEHHHNDGKRSGTRQAESATKDSTGTYNVYKGNWTPEDFADVQEKMNEPIESEIEAEEDDRAAFLAQLGSMKNGDSGWNPTDLSNILQAMASGPNSSPDWNGKTDTIRGRTNGKRPPLFGEAPPNRATSEGRTSISMASTLTKPTKGISTGTGKGAKQSSPNTGPDVNGFQQAHSQSTASLSEQFWRAHESVLPNSHNGMAVANEHSQKHLDPHSSLAAQYWSTHTEAKVAEDANLNPAKVPVARPSHKKTLSTSSTPINSVPTASTSLTEVLHPCQYAFTAEDATNLRLAVKMIEEEEDIESDTECAIAVAVVAANARKTATYLSFGRKGARKAWLYNMIRDEKKRELV